MRRDLALLTAQAPAEERDLWRSLQEEGVRRIEELAELGERALLGRDLRAEEAELDEVERRLGTLKGLLRRLRLNTEEELRVYLEEAHRQQEWVRASERQMEDQEAQVRALRREASRVALELRTRRKDAAGSLSQEVQRHLADLGMEEFLFQVAGELLEPPSSLGGRRGAVSPGHRRSLPGTHPEAGFRGRTEPSSPGASMFPSGSETPRHPGVRRGGGRPGGAGGSVGGTQAPNPLPGEPGPPGDPRGLAGGPGGPAFSVRREGDLTLVEPLEGEERRGEIARMLSGGEGVPEALEHARVLLEGAPVS